MSKWKKLQKQAAAGAGIQDPEAETMEMGSADEQPETGDQGSAGETEAVAEPPASSPLTQEAPPIEADASDGSPEPAPNEPETETQVQETTIEQEEQLESQLDPTPAPVETDEDAEIAKMLAEDEAAQDAGIAALAAVPAEIASSPSPEGEDHAAPSLESVLAELAALKAKLGTKRRINSGSKPRPTVTYRLLKRPASWAGTPQVASLEKIFFSQPLRWSPSSPSSPP